MIHSSLYYAVLYTYFRYYCTDPPDRWFVHRRVFITYIDHGMQYHQLMADMRDLCGFAPGQELTIK